MRKLLFLTFCLMIGFGSAAYAQGKTFHGFACKKNCEGHKAGYDWAVKKGVNSPSDCHTKSKSFNEGCLVRVQEKSKVK